MIDLNAVEKRLRREDPCLVDALRSLEDYLGQRMEMSECRRAVYGVLIKLAAYSMVAGARGAAGALWEDILSGRAFRALGILNFCTADRAAVLLRQPQGAACVARLRSALEQDDTITSAAEFAAAFRPDSLSHIYERMIPEVLRMPLGEYYTPEWLAECIVENALTAADRPAPQLRFMDPTCGAGTFLASVMGRVRQESGVRGDVVGLDVSPTAVLTARTNYLAAILERMEDEVLIPVYRCDVLRAPVAEQGTFSLRWEGGGARLPLALCEQIVREKRYDPEEILPYIEGGEENAGRVLDEMFAFFEEKADVIVGNPPWVNWENLSDGDREQSRVLRTEYGFYNGRGKNVRFMKDDISVLMTTVVIERFLRDGGLISFALRQAVFKSEKNGAMFRKFRLAGSGTPFRVLRVDDLGKIKPFAGVNIRAALVLMRKGEENRFPVPYFCWERKKGFLRTTRTPGVSVEMIESCTHREPMLAFPADGSDPTSLWVNTPARTLAVVEKVLGSNGYKARCGVFTGGANAVYWLDVLGEGEGGTLRVSNVAGRAKRRAERVACEIERACVYPLIQGHDIGPWKVAQGGYILFPHTEETKMWPVEEERMAREMPLTLGYLSRFRAELDARRGFAGWENEIRARRFYAILRIGEYTFAKYKVAWRYIAQKFITAVIEEREDPILGRKLCIPNEKVMYVGTDSKEEAFYLCGVLSSLPVSCCVRCYMNPTSISTHVLGKLRIPAFDPSDSLHREIADLCEAGHRETAEEKLSAIHAELDRAAARLYGITEEELAQLEGFET